MDSVAIIFSSVVAVVFLIFLLGGFSGLGYFIIRFTKALKTTRCECGDECQHKPKE